MLYNHDFIGVDWIVDEVEAMPDHIVSIGPIQFNEKNRYIPAGVSPRPGYIRYDLFPYLVEIIECFDPDSDVREVNLMKGVQTGYTTALESILLYYIGHIKSSPCMLITAEKELATARVENNIIPMINESGFSDLIRSADVGNHRKTGKTKNFLQWDGGGSLIFEGANNATKMRMHSVPLMLKDELDGWKRAVGQDGNSDKLTDARLSAYWSIRKIARGSTPLLEPSMIGDAYKRGDQRVYKIRCINCNFPQVIKMEHINKETGEVNGFKWDTEDGKLVLDSVRYSCCECGHEHYEHDKERLFSSEHGAFWEPTATPAEEGIRSYHLPAWYSPFGFRPWSKGVADYLESYNPAKKEVLSIDQYQEFYNNTLGMPFKALGSRVRLESVSAHRRMAYRLGQIPSEYAAIHSGSKVQFLTCQVDVHKKNLAVGVFGWCKNQISYVIDYWRFEIEEGQETCDQITSPVWQRLRELIEDKVYTDSDGTQFRICQTLIDAGYSNDTVCTFCNDYVNSVIPIIGTPRTARNQTIKEFGEFTTQVGTVGYRILVDHYKDRTAPVLRREWYEEQGEQNIYHWNAPLDITTKQLKELTVERRVEEVDAKGNTIYKWHRPGNVPNELWDLTVYGHASVEIMAWNICIKSFGLETVEWLRFWEYVEDPVNDEMFGRVAALS